MDIIAECLLDLFTPFPSLEQGGVGDLQQTGLGCNLVVLNQLLQGGVIQVQQVGLLGFTSLNLAFFTFIYLFIQIMMDTFLINSNSVQLNSTKLSAE